MCLSEDTRNLFDSFEFCRQDAIDLLEILKLVLSKIHGDTEKVYSSFHDLLQDNIKHLVEILPSQTYC